MRLRKCSEESEEEYSGAGYIKQDAEGRLCFTLYVHKEWQDNIIVPFLKMSAGTPGEIIPRESFWTLLAEDDKGWEWTSNPLLPGPRSWHQGQPPILRGSIREITCRKDSSPHIQSSVTRLTLYEDVEFPANTEATTDAKVGGRHVSSSSERSIARFRMGPHDITMRKGQHFVALELISPEGEELTALPLRVSECLQFVFSRTFSIITIEQLYGKSKLLVLRSLPSQEDHPRVKPPVPFTSVTGHDACYRLLDLYFQFIKDAPHDEWHPLSKRVYEVIESSASSWDAFALGLCVAVEGLLSDAFPDEAPLPQTSIEEIGKIAAIVQQSSIRDMKSRILDAICRLRTSTANMKMRALGARGAISNEHVAAWNKVRHAWAHGQRRNFSNQEFIDLINTVVVLFNNLIFHKIGYVGPFKDYSQRGWPKAEYPNYLRVQQTQTTDKAQEHAVE
jgi:hypothetical protein